MDGTRIVVVGGGAGGLELVTRLGRRLGRRGKAEITLIDRNPTHIWKPLLHEVATGALDSSIDEISYQSHAQLNGYRFQRGTLQALDRNARQLSLAPVLDDHGQEVLPPLHHRISLHVATRITPPTRKQGETQLLDQPRLDQADDLVQLRQALLVDTTDVLAQRKGELVA